jgi:ribonucleotide reductase beta subunit family protein with ferritin-like domain
MPIQDSSFYEKVSLTMLDTIKNIAETLFPTLMDIKSKISIIEQKCQDTGISKELEKIKDHVDEVIDYHNSKNYIKVIEIVLSIPGLFENIKTKTDIFGDDLSEIKKDISNIKINVEQIKTIIIKVLTDERVKQIDDFFDKRENNRWWIKLVLPSIIAGIFVFVNAFMFSYNSKQLRTLQNETKQIKSELVLSNIIIKTSKYNEE